MKRSLVAALLGVVALLVGAAPVVAQDGDASISVDPTVVAATEAEVTIEITGSGFGMDGFVVLCPEALGEPAAALDDPQGLCDVAQLFPYSPVDGAWNIPITFEVNSDMIADGALAILATDPSFTDMAATQLLVTDIVDDGEPLPDTGIESAALALIAVNLLAFGMVFLVADPRRRRPRST